MNKNILLFVGCDMTGKTEISTALANRYKWQRFKNSKEFDRFTDKTYNARNAFKYETPITLQMIQQCKFYKSGILLDRSIPCEYAYAKALNREFDEQLVWYYDEEFANIDARIIFCYKTYIDNFEDEYVSYNIQKNVYEYYKEYLTKTKMKYITLCTDSCDLEKELQEIENSDILK